MLSSGASCDQRWQGNASHKNIHFEAPSPSPASMNVSEIIDNSLLLGSETQLPEYKLQTSQQQFKQTSQACFEQLPQYQSSSKFHSCHERSQGVSQVPDYTMTFKEQLANMNMWFLELRPSEQVLLLVTLARQLNSVYLKMFSNFVEQLMANAAQEIIKLEAEANDIDVVQSLYHRSPSEISHRLIAFLPLLRHDASMNLRRTYIELIRQVRISSLDCSPRNEQWRQLLAIAQLHPALSIDDRTLPHEMLYSEMSHFNGYDAPISNSGGCSEAKSARLMHYPLPPDAPPIRADSGLGLDQVTSNGGVTSSSSDVSSSTVSPVQLTPASTSSPGDAFYPPQASAQPPSLSHQPLSRQLSLAPSVPNPNVNGGCGHHPSSPNSSGFLSGSDSHAPLSPQSSASSSGEDALGGGRSVARSTFLEDNAGMRNVPVWLKSLRLHKYAKLFQNLSYEEMQNITDEWLEARNVTKGARNKILVSIRRLRERQEQVRRLEQDLGSGNSAALRTCLLELRNVIATPFKRYSGPESLPKCKVEEGDLPGQITHCLWKAVSLMLVSRRYEEENYTLLGQIVDAIFDSEAFSDRQKNICSKWRQEVDTSRGPTFRKYLWDHPLPGGNCANLKPVTSTKKPLTSQWSGPLKPSANFATAGSGGISSSALAQCRLGGNSASSNNIHCSPFMIGTLNPTSNGGPCFMEAVSPTPAAHPAFLPLPPQPSEHLPLTKHNSFGNSATSGVPNQRSQVERTHSAPGSGGIMGFYTTASVSRMSISGAEQHGELLCTNRIRRPNECSSTADEEEQIANINRSLDLLAKKVTEAAIGDSDLSGE